MARNNASVVVELNGKQSREIRVREACKRLECTPFVLWKFEKLGKLRVRRERIGASELGPGQRRVWMNEEDIEKIKKTWKPAPRKPKGPERLDPEKHQALAGLAALCFPLFDEHCSVFEGEAHERFIFTEIVRVTGAHPVDVRILYEEWLLGLTGGMRLRERKEIEAKEREAWREKQQADRYATYREWKSKQSKVDLQIAKLKAGEK